MKEFKHGKITLLHCDCMDYMAGLSENEFDLAVVDPPYGISINMNMGRKKGQQKKHHDKKWDNKPPGDEYFDLLFNKSAGQVIWGGNYFRLPITKSWIFWDKQVPEGVSFADGELAWTSGNKTLIKCTIPYSGFVGSEGKIHPTQKPIALYKWIYSKYAKSGQRILDTHLGSGSSAIAAHYAGLEFVGMELDEDYYNAAVDRFRRETRQINMFHPVA